ncbi:hypothetical protein [uncultured Tateyamaria sp.]|uniref:hypothetical protein n=1 Tax=uncultured Tateyamaria sp. TaxID=455651 RepID=UPI0026272C42|nr:hypothetical protein [uncultured Tateyamaria sp.]
MAGRPIKAAIAAFCAVSIVGCAENTATSQRGFKAQYNQARTALEQGNYDKANRVYARLVTDAGPFEKRVRLEHGHSELRAGAFDQAAAIAQALAQSGSGKERAAALAVKGTADHEQGLALLRDGQTRAGAARLTAADKAIAEVLSTHPELDPLGALAGRQASIKVRLKALR